MLSTREEISFLPFFFQFLDNQLIFGLVGFDQNVGFYFLLYSCLLFFFFFFLIFVCLVSHSILHLGINSI